MRRRSGWRWLALAAFWSILTGCAPVPFRHPPPTLSIPPEIPRGRVEAQIQTLPSAPPDVPTAATDPFPPAIYRALTAAEVQRLAAIHAPGARLHEMEASWSKPHPAGKSPTTPARELRRAILLHTSRELQNRAAGAALEAYYRLAEAEGQTDLLEETITQLETAIAETRDMLEQQLKPPVDVEVWLRQLHQSQGDRLKAQLSIEELNSRLRRMLGLTACSERERIWNPEHYAVNDEPIDMGAAIGIALHHRPDLILLRLVIASLSPQTLGLIREQLQATYPLLADKPSGPMSELFAPLLTMLPAGRTEIELRRGQLIDWLREREAAVVEEVRQAVTAIRYHGRVAALAWQRERSHLQALQEAHSRRQQGLASFAELAQKHLEWLKARSDVLQETMAWYIARVRLWQAQGLLAPTCVPPIANR
ncbi:MAG: TolC family protein [Gemmataceae bacterium]|nr:TolC family protein [Gemmataceae bacterium]